MTSKSILQIPADVGQFCRHAALILESSRRFLDRNIKLHQEWAEADGETEWTVEFDLADIEATRDNLAKASEFLDWLAQHGEHGQEVERTE